MVSGSLMSRQQPRIYDNLPGIRKCWYMYDQDLSHKTKLTSSPNKLFCLTYFKHASKMEGLLKCVKVGFQCVRRTYLLLNPISNSAIGILKMYITKIIIAVIIYDFANLNSCLLML
jgi:hypothetical protein